MFHGPVISRELPSSLPEAARASLLAGLAISIGRFNDFDR